MTVATETQLDGLRRQLELARVEDMKLKHTSDPGLAVSLENNISIHVSAALNLIEIDPELRDLIPPPTIGEKEKLKESLLAEGVRDPLVIWLLPGGQRIKLLDGHTRRGIIASHSLLFDVVVKEFATQHEAKDWMLTNQLARRNITPEQRTYLLGKYYKEHKAAHGGSRQQAEGASGQIVHLKTAEQIAAEQGVNDRTLRRAESFADAVDQLGEQNPEAKQKILSGQADITAGKVESLAGAPKAVLAEAAGAITSEKKPEANPELRAVVLIACSPEKLQKLGPVPARELYQGDLFKKSVEYAELQGLQWFVLSAKHGLLSPDQELEPYDARIQDLKAHAEAFDWSSKVVDALKAAVPEGSPLVLLAGTQYQKAGGLAVRLEAGGYTLSAPLNSLGSIGKQKAWLKAEIERLQPAQAEPPTAEKPKLTSGRIQKNSLRGTPPEELSGFFREIIKHTPDKLLGFFEALVDEYPPAVARKIFEAHGAHLAKDHQSYISSLIEDNQNLLPFSALISDGTAKEIIQAQLNTPERCRAYLAWVADKQPNQLFVAFEDVFEACPSIAREQLLQYCPALSKGQISNLNRWLTDELGQAAVSEAELIARYDEIEAESKAPTKQPDFDLTDATEARRYLGQIADKEPGESPAALQRVIEASPDGLATLYAWACSHHDELIGEEAGRKLEALYLQALTNPAPAAELPSTPPPAYVFETEAALIQAARDLTHQKLLDVVQAMPDEKERHKAFALYNLFIDGVKYAESLIQGQPIDPPSLTQLYIFIQEQQVRSAKKAKPKPEKKQPSKPSEAKPGAKAKDKKPTAKAGKSKK